MKIPFVSFVPMEHELGQDLKKAFEDVFEKSWCVVSESQ